jgi:ATP-dependent Clp protease ATP-binding subunit ClpB
VLIGEPGVGKTAIVEWIAKKIAENDIPDNLLGKKIISLDMWALLAGAMFKWEFEERFKAVIQEVEKSDGKIILFIDEIHTIVGAGNQEWQADAGNLLKPSLARGELHLIGATTINEYRKYIEKDAALERRFANVMVDEPNKEDALAILRGIKDKYETHHGLKITDNAVESAVELSIKYISDRKLPDKAIDLMDEAMSSVKLKSISKPVELDILEKQIRTLQIELEAKKSEKWFDKEKLQDLEKNISEKQNEAKAIESAWKIEKDIITQIKSDREKIEDLKQKAIQLERDGNLWEVARLRYSEIPALEKNIAENEEKMKWLEQTGKTYLKDRVDANDIAEIVAKWTGIPAQKLLESEVKKLLHLDEILNKEVIGQENAVAAISWAIKRARAWLAEEHKPLGSFLFLGPTWVGKTQTAKALAKQLFNDEKNMIRIDMSEYMEKFSVSRLIGSAPGYVWYEEWGQLTEAVRRKPYSVILFDEVEKAHPDVFNLLLQVLDDGRLTDNKGRTVNFSNTIIILTSNIWSQKIQELTAQNKNSNKIYDEIYPEVKQFFRPEFLNRLDEVIVFNPLEQNNIIHIVENLLSEIYATLKNKNISLEISGKFKKHIAEVWFDRDFWARPLKRIITHKILNYLSEKIISGEVKSWDKIFLDLDENNEIILQK